jgi:hypothetical protein
VPDKREWRVEQVLVDEQDLNDWSVVFEVDLDGSDAEGEVVLTLVKLGPVTGE